ncbi:hypothetical protein LTR16_010452, partial [Cryomyces antarcticus]
HRVPGHPKPVTRNLKAPEALLAQEADLRRQAADVVAAQVDDVQAANRVDGEICDLVVRRYEDRERREALAEHG